jgi:hypothetical protein
VFAVADTFGKPDNTNTVLDDRVRLQMVTSFTGKDKLFTRLTAGNFGTSFAATNGTQEGRFAYDGSVDNTVAIDRLHYVFPLGKKLTVTAMANTAGHWFYSDTFNPGLEAGGGGTGALSRFGERNAIYRFGALGQGVGVKYALSDQIEVTAGYLAGNGSNPAVKSGLFNGRYSALGQIVFKPSKQLKVGLTYANNYDPKGQFNFGGTGTNVANGIRNLGAINSNAYGVEGQFDLSPKLSVRVGERIPMPTWLVPGSANFGATPWPWPSPIWVRRATWARSSSAPNPISLPAAVQRRRCMWKRCTSTK